MPPAKRVSHLPDVIDYSNLLSQHTWIIEPNKQCVINADTDGFLCGLLLSHFLNWKIVGYYEGRVLALDASVDPKSCVYIDVEIYRKTVHSIGQHMVLYNKNHKPSNWDNFSSCINPNILRNFDHSSDFQRKYPFATAHLLISILNKAGIMNEINYASYPILLFADGTYKNILGYVENCIDWFKFLQIDQKHHILNDLFFVKSFTLTELGKIMNEVFETRNLFNAVVRYVNGVEIAVRGARSGHNLIMSDNAGQSVNLCINGDGSCDVYANEKERIVKFIKFLSSVTGHEYKDEAWMWNNLKVYLLTKKIIDPKNGGGSMNILKFKSIMEGHALSIANTSTSVWEYTDDLLGVFN